MLLYIRSLLKRKPKNATKNYSPHTTNGLVIEIYCYWQNRWLRWESLTKETWRIYQYIELCFHETFTLTLIDIVLMLIQFIKIKQHEYMKYWIFIYLLIKSVNPLPFWISVENVQRNIVCLNLSLFSVFTLVIVVKNDPRGNNTTLKYVIAIHCQLIFGFRVQHQHTCMLLPGKKRILNKAVSDIERFFAADINLII